ncbi:MAG TPA: hypothetical protein VGG72_21335 [Bryobacteraceae bacterium]|jgi:hypothetical protein
MVIDFKEMKDRIPLVDVLLHYGVRLRRKIGSDYASVSCPLPTHPKDDRSNNAFGVHLPSNRWQCKHPECGRRNGVGDKWGDCINLVMTMRNLTYKEAGQQLENWFPKEKSAPSHGESRTDGKGKNPPHHHTRNDTSQSGSVKGYMQDVNRWFDELSIRAIDEDDAAYRNRLLSAIKERLLESYRAGKAARLVA